MTDTNKGKSEDEKSANLLTNLNNPIKLITSGAILSLKSGRNLLLTFFIFGIVNFVLSGFALYKLFTNDFSGKALWGLILVLAIGTTFTAFATHRAYRQLMLDALQSLYVRSSSLINKIVLILISRFQEFMKGNTDVNDQQMQKALNISTILNEKYSRLPGAMRKGISLLLGRIPMAGMLMELRPEIESGNTEAAAVILTNKIDFFLQSNVFRTKKFWTSWVLLVGNILVIGVIIRWLIG